MAEQGIVTRSLRREFKDKAGRVRAAVSGVDLTVEPGELVSVLGPNGAGKTTTVRLLTGLLTPTSGSARVGGHDIVRERRAASRACGFSLGGDLGLYPRLTALQNLTFFGLMYGLRGSRLRQRSVTVLEQMGLADRAGDTVGTFSRGMKQRLHLARALLHEPSVLILDEPSAGLDPQSAAAMRRLVGGLAAEGRSILLTTHDMREAEELSDRVVLMKDGAVHSEATPGRLRVTAAARLGHSVQIIWTAAEESVPACDACPGLLESRQDRGTTRLRVRDGAAAAGWVLARFGDQVASVSVTPPSLEEVFLDMVDSR
ncbi:ATP-binding cassette domain-containing protein [Streptomyces sp. NPDC055089]